MLDQWARTYGEEDQTLVFGTNTYRLMQRFAPAETDPSKAPLNAARKLIISRTLEEPLDWPNSTLIAEDALKDAAPVSYQLIEGKLVGVESRYKLLKGEGGGYEFAVGAYDPRYPLIIDPALDYSTFLGGREW